MSKYQVTWIYDDSGYRAFAAMWPGALKAYGEALCNGIVADVKLELSRRQSPASYGGPPGVDTGALRASIKYTQKGRLTWWVHDEVEYGVYLELGRLNTRTGVHMTWPFMTPVFMRWKNGKAEKLAAGFGIFGGGFGSLTSFLDYG